MTEPSERQAASKIWLGFGWLSFILALFFGILSSFFMPFMLLMLSTIFHNGSNSTFESFDKETNSLVYLLYLILFLNFIYCIFLFYALITRKIYGIMKAIIVVSFVSIPVLFIALYLVVTGFHT
jgi:hypothetical protein